MLAAILFDLDGTLVNTDPVHYKAWQEILRDYGLKIDEEFYKRRISGRLNPVIIQDILPHLSFEAGLQLAEEKETRFRELAVELAPLPGLPRVLEWIDQHELKRAVVTNAPRKNVHFMLQVLGLLDLFSTVVLAEEATAGKPDPAPYKLALSHLGVTPDSTIAFEDSPSGIHSSIGAGICTVGIASTHDPKNLYSAGAEMVIPDFTTKSLWSWLYSQVRKDTAS